MRVVSLTDNVAVITALANDYGYEHVFVMQLEPLLQEALRIRRKVQEESPDTASSLNNVFK